MSRKVRSARPALNWRWCLPVTGNPLLPELRTALDFAAAPQSPRGHASQGLRDSVAITQPSGNRHTVFSILPLAAGILCAGSRNAEESRHDHATQDDAGNGRIYLDTVDCRERLRSGAALIGSSRSQKSAVRTSSSKSPESVDCCLRSGAARRPSSRAIRRIAAFASDSPLKPSPTTILLPS